MSEGCSELEIPHLARMPLIKKYWMLQNAKVTAFTVSELLRENQWKKGVAWKKGGCNFHVDGF